jgi:hypothetical protein
MTLDEARRLLWMFNQPYAKAVVLSAEIQERSDGDFVFVVEPVEGKKQLFSDSLKATWALTEWSAEASKVHDRYFLLGEDGTLIECDLNAWVTDAQNRNRKATKIVCSPEVEASICFIGRSSATMDGDIKVWNAQFYSPTQNVHYPGPAFRTFEDAKAFVDRYIAKGSPKPGAPQYMLFMAENSAS